jgi:hypothetical protein
LKEKGEKLEVFNPIGNWPNSINFVTNYGVLELDFPVDITSIEKIIKFGEKYAFVPTEGRLIQMSYDVYNGEVAQNAYGSAFMLKKDFGDSSFILYLAALSFYSAPNSQMFKMI